METKQCFSIFLIVLWMSVLAGIPASAAAPVDGDQLCVSGAGTTGANGTYTYNGGATEFQKGTYIIFYVLPLTNPPDSDWKLSNPPTELYITDPPGYQLNDMITPGFNGVPWHWITGRPPAPIVQNGPCPPVPGYGSNPASGSTISMTTTQGTNATSTLTVSETGNATLTITNITVTGTDAATFSATPTNFSIADGGADQTVTVTCDTSTVGTFTNATLNVTHNAAGSPATYPLSCTVNAAPAPGYGSSPAPGGTLTFATTPGVAVTQTLTVSETGNAALTVNSATITGAGAAAFSVTAPTFPFTITDGGAAQPVTIQCQSATAGTYTAALDVAHNATGSPATYNLTCTVSANQQPQPQPQPQPAPNTPPRVDQPVPDIWVVKGTAPKTLSLFPYVSDAEDADEQLTYTIIYNRKPNIASASLTDGTLTVTFLKYGVTKIGVRVTDSGGLFTDVYFKVHVHFRPHYGGSLHDLINQTGMSWQPGEPIPQNPGTVINLDAPLPE